MSTVQRAAAVHVGNSSNPTVSGIAVPTASSIMVVVCTNGSITGITCGTGTFRMLNTLSSQIWVGYDFGSSAPTTMSITGSGFFEVRTFDMSSTVTAAPGSKVVYASGTGSTADAGAITASVDDILITTTHHGNLNDTVSSSGGNTYADVTYGEVLSHGYNTASAVATVATTTQHALWNLQISDTWQCVQVAIFVPGPAAPSDPYSSAVLTDAPLAYWKLDEPASPPTGFFADVAGARPMPIVGTPTSDTGAKANTGTSAAFPGSTSVKGSIAGASVSPWLGSLGSLTLEVWIKTSTATGTMQILCADTGSGATRTFQFRVNAGKIDWIPFNNAGNPLILTSPSSYADGVWHHVVGTYTGVAGKLYVDNVLVVSGNNTGTGTGNPTGGLVLAGDNTSGSAYTGSIDEVAIYGTALSATRVAAHYTAASSSSGSWSLAGTAAGSTAVSGALGKLQALGGSSAGSSAVTGALSEAHPLAGSSVGSTTVSGALMLGSPKDLAGTAAGVTAVSGSLAVAGALAGSVAGVTSVTGALTMGFGLAGSASGSTLVSGGLSGPQSLAGASAGATLATGSLTVTTALAGASSGRTVVTAALGTVRSLFGTSNGATTVTGGLTLFGGLVGSADGTSSVTGHLSVTGSIVVSVLSSVGPGVKPTGVATPPSGQRSSPQQRVSVLSPYFVN